MRLIDADALMGARKEAISAYENANIFKPSAIRARLKPLLDLIVDTPTIDPESLRPVGWWERSEYNGFLRCSACEVTHINEDWLVDDKWNFCPNCGAKMEKIETEEET